MPRYNPREGDPQRYARAMAQQSELRKQCAGQYTVATGHAASNARIAAKKCCSRR